MSPPLKICDNPILLPPRAPVYLPAPAPFISSLKIFKDQRSLPQSKPPSPSHLKASHRLVSETLATERLDCANMHHVIHRINMEVPKPRYWSDFITGMLHLHITYIYIYRYVYVLLSVHFTQVIAPSLLLLCCPWNVRLMLCLCSV